MVQRGEYPAGGGPQSPGEETSVSRQRLQPRLLHGYYHLAEMSAITTGVLPPAHLRMVRAPRCGSLEELDRLGGVSSRAITRQSRPDLQL
jgi:hypothetical protein